MCEDGEEADREREIEQAFIEEQAEGGMRHDMSKLPYLVQVYFRPVVGSEAEMKALFSQEGSPQYTSIRVFEKFGFLRFASTSEACLFVEKFDRMEIGSTKLHVEMSRKAKLMDVPPCRRLYLSGYYSSKSRNDVTERDLWDLVAPLGFVRRIIFHSTYSLVDFDTVEEAATAQQQIERTTLRGRKVAAAFAKTFPSTEMTNASVQLSDLIPATHEFWKYLSEVMHPRKD